MDILVSRTAERQVLQILLEKLLMGIRNVIAQTQQEPFTYSESGFVTRQCMEDVFTNARSFLDGYVSKESWESVERHLNCVLSEFKSFDDLIMDNSSSELDMLSRLSCARLCIGLAQSCLLCPSPIDPIVTTRTKYQCIHYQVKGSYFRKLYNVIHIFRSSMYQT